jgi:hypothetical protein
MGSMMWRMNIAIRAMISERLSATSMAVLLTIVVS